MVCYARPAIRMAALVLVVLLLFGRSAGHFLDTAALMAAIAITVGGAAVAAVLAVVVFGAVRRRRAAAGGCVGCRFQCQHAMTEQQPRRRLVVVSTAERGAGAAPAAPRWPDRPVVQSRERAGSGVLPG